MDLLPILSTLRRHKTAAALIVLEIALTSAIVCNALHLIGVRLDRLRADNGLPEQALLVQEVRGVGSSTGADASALSARDLQALRAVPGVQGVALINQVLYGMGSNNTSVRLDRAPGSPRVTASNYEGSEGLLQTLGLRLVEGRDFKPEEYIDGWAMAAQAAPSLPQVILSRELAAALFPGRTAVGQTIYAYGDGPSTVVGVVDGLVHPYPGRIAGNDRYTMLFPVRPDYRFGTYLLRTDPARRDAVLQAARAALEQIDARRVVPGGKRLSDMRSSYDAQDRAMAWLMGGVCVALLLVTAFGIVGLASFWVQQRTRMIGTRRALGATRAQILRYFQLENLLLSTIGIVLGIGGALALSLLLMAQYEVPRLPWLYLPAGALALWVLGQLAVLAPARRAAALPPVAALRA